MPPRVTFWTGTWNPLCEAHSRQIELLRAGATPRPFVVSIATGQRLAWLVRQRVFRASGASWPLARLASRWIELRGDVSHVFGSLATWHLLRTTGRRPVVFTVTIDDPEPNRECWDRVAVFAAEDDVMAGRLRDLGVESHRIVVIPPGVDTDVYRPPAKEEHRDVRRILFASSPASVDEFDARGLPQLADLARIREDVRIRVLWRPWDDEAASRAALERLSPPPNLEVIRGVALDMADQLRWADVVTVPFARGFGKSSPNSAIEGLACGRPVLLTPGSGLEQHVRESGAGVVAGERSGEGLAVALAEIERDFPDRRAAARSLALATFSGHSFRFAYAELYGSLASQEK